MKSLDELSNIISKMETLITTDSSLYNSPDIALWWKDKDFRFVRYNKGMLKMLYPKASENDLLGKTDWEYAKESGATQEQIDHIKNCCSFSDEYIVKSSAISMKFYERCVVEGRTVWLLTVKARIPPSSNSSNLVGVFGVAQVSTLAERIISSGLFTDCYEKLSENCFRIIEKVEY